MNEPVMLRREGAVAHIRFNRPAQFNTVNVAAAQAFLDCCRKIADAPDIRAVVLSGAGDVFGAGGDLNELSDDAVAGALALIPPVHEAVLLMAQLDVPFIASLHGVVAGGSLSLAMACDLAIAAEGTKFNLAYVNIAASCDGSGSWSLPRIVGMRHAMAIALLGETFGADEALRLGLVNRVVPLAALESSTREWAERLANGPTRAIGRLKRLVRSSFEDDLRTRLDRELDEFVANARSDDFTGAVDAFLHKRRPHFNGR
jgi:2-(1,2-epoxy-1,2-dihydrophenyl)acetyl-CoA isomerase